LFAQLMDFLPWTSFARSVARYGGDRRVRSLSCAEQFRAMAFAQLTFRESLRDIEACLGAQPNKLYHLGFRSPVRRSTLAEANENRDWRIHAEVAQRLIAQARRLYAGDGFGVELNSAVYALDSTTIDLCMSLFPWAHFRSAKSAVKMHTLLDLRGSIPAFIRVTTGDTHDVHMLDQIAPEPGAFYVMDRGYLDFARLHRLGAAGAFFVVRGKIKQRVRRITSRPVDRTGGIICDQTVVLTIRKTLRKYPAKLRRGRYRDPETGKTLIFLTNNFELPSRTIADLYRCRWQIEVFFKWIKQHLRIRSFFGATENAVKTQIWIAVAAYVLIAIVKKRLALGASLYTILQMVSVTAFEKIPLDQLLNLGQRNDGRYTEDNQLNLFDD